MVVAEGLIEKFRPPASLRQLVHGRLRGEPVAALEGVSFAVEPGEAFGLMGPNGAGKSTLLRIFAGLVAPDGGHARVAGLDCARGGPLLGAKVGYLAADERGLTLALSPRELVAFFGALHGLARRAALQRADELMDEVGLSAVARRPIGELSTGMRRRTGLARALLGAPSLLLLDEPTRGLDPAGALALRAQLQAALRRGVVLVLATHDVAEAQSLVPSRGGDGARALRRRRGGGAGGRATAGGARERPRRGRAERGCPWLWCRRRSLRRRLAEETVRWTPLALSAVAFAGGLMAQAYLGRLVDAGSNQLLGGYDGHYAAFLLLGVMLLDLQTTLASGLSSRIREAQLSGSLETLLATPTPTGLLLFGMILPDVLWALGRVTLYAADRRRILRRAAGRGELVGRGGGAAGRERRVHRAGAGVGGADHAAAARQSAQPILGRGGADRRRRDLSAARFCPRRWPGLGALLPIAPALDGVRAAIVRKARDRERSAIRCFAWACSCWSSGRSLFGCSHARSLARAQTVASPPTSGARHTY